MSVNDCNFLIRFYVYQKERFPFLVHGLLIAAFSFSAISYSRLCQGMHTFIAMPHYWHCIFITITLFLLVRIFDEHKDKEDDALYRKNLPVPRGLIKLKELRTVGIVIAALQVVAIVYWQMPLLYLYAVVIAYLCLMGVEFFIPRWLKQHQFWYVTSHMFIIPLVDIYASSYDWHLRGVAAPMGLLFFFAVSYFNGIVLELGRKIKTPQHEEPGVLSYTHLLGTKKAPIVWLLVLCTTAALAIAAARYAHAGNAEYIILISLLVLCSIPAFLFLQKPHHPAYSKAIEIASAIWTFGMYLCLGGIPMLIQLFS